MCIELCSFTVKIPLKPKDDNYQYTASPRKSCCVPRSNQDVSKSTVPKVAAVDPTSPKISEVATVASNKKIDLPEKTDEKAECLVEKAGTSTTPSQAKSEKEPQAKIETQETRQTETKTSKTKSPPQPQAKPENEVTKEKTLTSQTKPKTQAKLQKPQKSQKPPTDPESSQSTNPTLDATSAPSPRKILKPPRKSVTFAPMLPSQSPQRSSSPSTLSSTSDDSYTDPPSPVMAHKYFGTQQARVLGESGFANENGKERVDEAIRRAVRKRDGLVGVSNGNFYLGSGLYSGRDRPTWDAVGQRTLDNNVADPVDVEINRNGKTRLPRYFPPADTRQRNSNFAASPIFEQRGMQGMQGIGVGKASTPVMKKGAAGTSLSIPSPAARLGDDDDTDADSAIDVDIPEYSASHSAAAWPGVVPGVFSSMSPQPRTRASLVSDDDDSDDPIIVYRSKKAQSLTNENEPIFVARPAAPTFASNKGKGTRNEKSKGGRDFLMSGALGAVRGLGTKGKVYQRPSVESVGEEED